MNFNLFKHLKGVLKYGGALSQVLNNVKLTIYDPSKCGRISNSEICCGF